MAVSKADMERLAARLSERAEVIADFRGVHREGEFTARRQDVLDLLRRRPCTTDDVAAGLGMHPNEAAKYVAELLQLRLVVAETGGRRVYYRVLSRSK